MKKKNTIRILVECALLIAIATVLCIYPKIKFLPYGGSVTLCSMLPVILISYRHGIRWGLLSGFAFSLIQLMTNSSGFGFSLFTAAMIVIFDFLVAFTVLGVGGIFRGKLKSAGAELALGSFVALSLRYVSHVISGYFVWGEYAEWFFGEAGGFGSWVTGHISGNALALVYSLCYNATYMIPEIILTVVVSLILSRYALFKVELSES